MRSVGLVLSSLAFFAALLPAAFIMQLENPRLKTMSLFYLSFILTLFLSYTFSAAGRAHQPNAYSDKNSMATQLRVWGFPILCRHAWSDFGQLYALVFLTFTAPILLSLFATLLTSAFIGFEQEVATRETGSGLSRADAFRQISVGNNPLIAGDQTKVLRIKWVTHISFFLGLCLSIPCFARLVPVYFWRGTGHFNLKLAKAWRRISWRLALVFGLLLLLVLVLAYVSPFALPTRYALATLGLALWASCYARHVGPYDSR